MVVIFTPCAGLDVHKKRITACRVIPDPTGQQPDGLLELRDFGILTSELLALADWLADVGVTHVAMESTGEYWRPVYNLLEGTFTVFLVNAAHVKRVPGRKTDKADARWQAKLMRYGLLQASFIPTRPVDCVTTWHTNRTTWSKTTASCWPAWVAWALSPVPTCWACRTAVLVMSSR
jgi:transposase